MGLPLFLSDTLGLTKIPPHIPTILWSFAGFTFVHLVLAPWICSRWFPAAYGTKTRATKNNWAIHVVSQVHSIIIVAGALYSVWTETPDRKADKFYGWSNTTDFVHGIAVGYFLWDSFDAVINYVDFGFVVHGIACLLVYVLTYKPFVAYYATRCLLWEISTIFLNIHWFLDKTGNTGTTFQLVNGVLLLVAFFGVRLVYGGYISTCFFITLPEVWRDVPVFYILVYGVGNIVLMGLNIFWFTKMVAALRKRFEPKNAERTGLLGSNGAADAANGVH